MVLLFCAMTLLARIAAAASNTTAPAGITVTAAPRNTAAAARGRATQIPSWVRMTIPQRFNSQREYEANMKLVKEAAAANRVYDMAMYGDSIVSFFRKDKRRVWDQVFKGYTTTPLAMIGTNLQELAFRIAKGGEFLQPHPKVAILACGYINLRWRKDDPAPLMDWLVGYLRARMPSTKIVLMALLDNEHVSEQARATNVKYKAIARKRGAVWLDCRHTFDPTDPRLTFDGTHPTELEGQRRILRCIKAGVQRYM